MEVQTRSEENGILLFETVREAFEFAEKDESIWKISFTDTDDSRARWVKLPGFCHDGKSIWVFDPFPTADEIAAQLTIPPGGA